MAVSRSDCTPGPAIASTERAIPASSIVPRRISAKSVSRASRFFACLGSTPCTVGQWVTVTKDNGIVPSMSVTWRRLETMLTSWTGTNNPVQPNDGNEKKREVGIAVLASALRSAHDAPQISRQDWMPRTDTVVSR